MLKFRKALKQTSINVTESQRTYAMDENVQHENFDPRAMLRIPSSIPLILSFNKAVTVMSKVSYNTKQCGVMKNHQG